MESSLDVRATKNLEVCLKEEVFREDLYYGLTVIQIQTSSLREVFERIQVSQINF